MLLLHNHSLSIPLYAMHSLHTYIWMEYASNMLPCMLCIAYRHTYGWSMYICNMLPCMLCVSSTPLYLYTRRSITCTPLHTSFTLLYASTHVVHSLVHSLYLLETSSLDFLRHVVVVVPGSMCLLAPAVGEQEGLVVPHAAHQVQGHLQS